MRRQPLHVREILEWADAHRARTGEWPQKKDGVVSEAPTEKWSNIDQALRKGLRGFPGNWSLPQLLAEYRGHRNRKRLPKFSKRQILAWADGYFKRKGRWPINTSGAIPETRGETWMAVDMALRHGQRGMPGGSSLAELLASRRRVPNRMRLPKLTETQILKWIDAHHRRTGMWPMAKSGIVLSSRSNTWMAIDQALKHGSRGLPGGSSLAKLLLRERGVGRHVRRLK